MRFIVTGAAGFVGSNIIAGLNARGIKDIIAVDDLTQAYKYRNMADLEISDYFDRYDFLDRLKSGSLGKIQAVFHEGACSDTMESDGHYMMENNYRYTLDLLDICTEQKIALLYASSAATYGGSEIFIEERQYEKPLNVYGYSKFLFDQILRQRIAEKKLTSQVVGFRYFNVYGPRESHKGRMASVAFHHFNQFQNGKTVKLFGPYDGYNAGEQSRDFVYIDDVVKVNFFFLDNPHLSGIFNLGSGRAQPFNDVARAVVNHMDYHLLGASFKEKNLTDLVAEKRIEYIDFPEDLKGKYQSFTQANLDLLRSVGYQENFHSVEQGVSKYIQWLFKNANFLSTPTS
ncbi:ADP-glyceromanno-heptose 6-epimerase [Polynucleobacter rarus]|uniref:ADP-glyceromanno-heptose 6-epimerase n=1 Tax=Polynucleobacter rarus TaxID=556055 RepID=UPI000D3E492E|nr:ADP-glyceromanno-heptose 6-epimerase [Polynucleobacter rarus]